MHSYGPDPHFLLSAPRFLDRPALPKGVRQQAWYENARSFRLKLALAAALGLGGVGAWAAGGIGLMTPDDKAIWDEFAAFVHGASDQKEI